MQTGGQPFVTFFNLPTGDKLIAAEALLTLIVVVLVLQLLPYRFWRAQIAAKAGGAAVGATSVATPTAPAVHTARRVGRMVTAVARRLPGQPKCLAQALAARRMLKRRGIESELNLGVRNERAAINAHAWLAVGTLIVTGGPDISGFSRFGKAAQ